jgi:hypothetical protein
LADLKVSTNKLLQALFFYQREKYWGKYSVVWQALPLQMSIIPADSEEVREVWPLSTKGDGSRCFQRFQQHKRKKVELVSTGIDGGRV